MTPGWASGRRTVRHARIRAGPAHYRTIESYGSGAASSAQGRSDGPVLDQRCDPGPPGASDRPGLQEGPKGLGAPHGRCHAQVRAARRRSPTATGTPSPSPSPKPTHTSPPPSGAWRTATADRRRCVAQLDATSTSFPTSRTPPVTARGDGYSSTWTRDSSGDADVHLDGLSPCLGCSSRSRSAGLTGTTSD